MTFKKIEKLERAGFKWYGACRLLVYCHGFFHLLMHTDSLTGRNPKEWVHGKSDIRSCNNTSMIMAIPMSLPSSKRTAHLVDGCRLNETCTRNFVSRQSSTTWIQPKFCDASDFSTVLDSAGRCRGRPARIVPVVTTLVVITTQMTIANAMMRHSMRYRYGHSD